MQLELQIMKAMKANYLSLLLLGATLAAAGAEPARTDLNPATLYYQAFLLAPEPMSNADMDYLYSREGRSHNLPERYASIFAGYDHQFGLVRQAAHATVPCDWGIDMSPGPATLLPHLGRAKAVAQAARLRVMWELQHGLQVEAREDLLGTFALARNVSRDGTMIAALVQNAMEAILCCTVAETFGQFTTETLQQVVEGLDAIPARGTVAGSISGEKAFFQDWLVNRIVELRNQNPADDAKVMTGIHALLAGLEHPEAGQSSTTPSLWEQANKASGGISQGISDLLQDAGRMYHKVAAVAALPALEFEPAAKELSAEIQKSANPFVLAVLPSLEKARYREFRIVSYVAMLRAAVEYKLHGDAGLQSVPDPCTQGQFAFRRFLFEDVDRGFELKSTFDLRGGDRAVLIFVEKPGTPFRVDGPHVGDPLPATQPK
jgi:hypothetical protein